jgi:hypothetical protein
MQAYDMVSRVLARLDQPGGGWNTPVEALSAINEGLRFFALLTLGIQRTATVQLTLNANGPSVRMLSVVGDWLMPLRISTAGSPYTVLRPARLAELDALDAGWQSNINPPTRYCALGFDFTSFYPQWTGSLSLETVYAASPHTLVADTDVPEIPADHHPDLVDYGVYRLRFREGAGEFAKALPYLQRFLNGAKKYGAYIRARNLAARYDKLPFELERADLSMLLTLSKKVAPMRGAQ